MAQGNPINVNPSSVTFSTANGTPQPAFVGVTSATGASVPFTTSVSSPIFSVFPPSGTATATSQNLQISVVNPNQPTGSYTGTVTLTPSTGTPTVIMATLNVGTNSGGGGGTGATGAITATPNPVVFNVSPSFGFGVQAVSLSLLSGTEGVTISASGPSWLSVSPTSATLTSGTPTNINVLVDATSLIAGTYSAAINVAPASGSGASLSIPVNLTVGSSSGGTGSGTLAVNPASLAFNFPTGATQTSFSTVSVSTSSNPTVNVSAVANTTGGGNWLTVNQTAFGVTSSFPFTLGVSVNPQGLTPGQTYTGNVALTGSDGSALNIPVTALVGSGTGGGGGSLSATPNPIAINIPAGSTSPGNQILTVTNLGFATTVSAQTSGISWLSVNPVSQQISNASFATYNVSANPPVGTASGVYNGTVVLTPFGGNALNIPVTVTIGTAGTLSLTPASLAFAYQTGTAFPAPQSVSVASAGSALGFSAVATTQSGGNWLVVTPVTGITNGSGGAPSMLSVQVNPSGLPNGSYTGQIAVTSNGSSNGTQTIPVTLLVTNQPILQLGASSVTFVYQYGSATQPSQQQIQVGSSGNPLGFSATVTPGSGGNFLSVTPSSGTSPQTLNLAINPVTLASLAPGNYSSSVTLNASSAGNNPVTIPVNLVIGNNTLLSGSQTALNFNYQVGQAGPATQTFTVSSTGTPLNYNVAAASTNCGGNFLSATSTPFTTPATVAVSINSQGLPVGTCNGTITVTAAGSGNTLTIPVTVLVSNSPLLNVSPGAINVTAQTGTTPPNQTVALTSTDPTVAIGFNSIVTTNGTGGWLLVGPTTGTTPNTLSVGFQTAGLQVGTYTGSITVTPISVGASTIPPTVIPVTLVITSTATASVSPASLTFMQAFNGTQPASQTLQITSTNPGITFSASATPLNGGNWLSVTPASGTTPGAVMVSANGTGLGQGSYSGIVTVLIPGAANNPLNIPVTLNVLPPQSLAVTPTTLNFTYAAGAGSGPAAQNVQVTSNSGAVPFTVTTASSSSGLVSATPTSGTTPGTVAISLNQTVLSTLAAGTYTGTVTINSQTGGSQTIAVNVTVTAAPPPAVTTVVNSASNQPGAVAPGEIITIYGSNIGPTTAVGLQLTSGGMVSTTLSGTTVTFDGIPAPLIYVSGNQINAIVPYEIAGRVSTNVVVNRGTGNASAALQLQVVNTAPSIFSVSMGGSGQGAILNSDNSVNSAQNPAAVGKAIQIFATGEGALQPPVVTGAVTSAAGPTFPKPINSVSVTIGGVPATVVYAGEAPGLVSGVLQVNVLVPQGLGTGPKTVMLTVGNASNQQQTITAAIQ